MKLIAWLRSVWLWCWLRRPWRKKPRVIRGVSARIYVNGVEIGQLKEISYQHVRSEPGEHAYVLPNRVEEFLAPPPTTVTMTGYLVREKK